MDRMRKLMGFSSSHVSSSSPSSSTPSSSSTTSSSSRFDGYHAKTSGLGRYSHSQQQQQHHQVPDGNTATGSSADDYEQNNHLAGVNLGSGKMTVSKSGRWKKKERKRLSIWDEESATSSATDGPASLPGVPTPASPQGSSHRIVFQELGKHKRSKAPPPPPLPPASSSKMSSVGSGAPKPYDPWSSTSRSTLTSRQRAPVLPPLVTAPKATPSGHAAQPPSLTKRSVFPFAQPEDDTIDDATIAGLIEDFEATIGMHDDDYDLEDETNQAKSVLQGASSSRLKTSGGSRALATSGASPYPSESAGAAKPQIAPRQVHVHHQQRRY